jgi:hypothetical protein
MDRTIVVLIPWELIQQVILVVFAAHQEIACWNERHEADSRPFGIGFLRLLAGEGRCGERHQQRYGGGTYEYFS